MSGLFGQKNLFVTNADGNSVLSVDNLSLAKTTTIAGALYKDTFKFLHTYYEPGTDGMNLFMGVNSGNITMSAGGGSASLASNNLCIGYGTLNFNTTGWRNTAFGISALQNNTTGDHNAAFGQNALLFNTVGVYNTALGIDALRGGLANSYNTAVGQNALLVLASSGAPNGQYNTVMGYNVAPAATQAYHNTIIGAQAAAALTTGMFNTIVGYGAMAGVTTRYNNTALGYQSGPRTTNTWGGVFLGFKAGYYETGNDKLYIDNAARTDLADGRVKALVYGVFDAAVANQYLTINGQLRVSGAGSHGIGTASPNANAILDITSTTKAFMPPRMTSAEKAAIPGLTAGMVVFDSTLMKLCVYTTAWEIVTSI